MPGPRATSLAGEVQRRLERVYGLSDLPPVDDFARPADEGDREVVLVREDDDGVSLAVVLPAAGLAPPDQGVPLDTLCQVVEGVSHFVCLAERIRCDAQTTQLELELQAEVDKFVLLALGSEGTVHRRRMHARLYEDVSFLHHEGTVEGERYRIANDLAARFCARLLADTRDVHERLRRFFRAGQADKIRLARAA